MEYLPDIANKATLKKEICMPKGHEDHRGGKKKAKFTLKEKRQLKREKRQREHEINSPHPENTI